MNNFRKHLPNCPKCLVITEMKCSLQKFWSKVVFLACLFLPFIHNFAAAQAAPQKTRLLFVFDDSFSMFGEWQSGKKIEIAKKLMSEFLDSLKNNSAPDIEIALRIYGHQTSLWPGPVNCEDTKLEVPFDRIQPNVPKMKKVINGLTPTGTTPIAYSLGRCAYDFPDVHARNIIILITDGLEECKGDPCAVSLELQKKGVIIKPFVIGIGLDVTFADAFKCIGKFYDASSEIGFRNILNMVIAQALNNTTAQVNLLDIHKKPTETDVAVTFYDEYSGVIRYNFMHTLNALGNPDTIFIDPIGTYKMVVHTIPEVIKTGIRISAGKHNIIPADAPQGYLFLKVGTTNTTPYGKLECIVRKKGETGTLHVMNFNSYDKFIVGKYDLEILTLPRIKFNDVEISQSKTTNLEIPPAGTAAFYKPAIGPSSVYLEDKNELTWVCNLNTNALNEGLALQPGKYRIVYRPLNAKATVYTLEKKFTVTSGTNVEVKIQ